MVTISVKQESDLPLPEYRTPGSVGLDLPANETTIINPGHSTVIGTGLYMAVPDGYECQIRPRSGLAAKHAVTVVNTPGTIDQDYRGEIKVILINHGKEPFNINRGDRIAQLVVSKVEKAQFVVNELNATMRGEGGLGSTGKR